MTAATPAPTVCNSELNTFRQLYSCRDVSIAIPTYGRDQVLIDTIRHCLEQSKPAREIIVVDQTTCHSDATERILSEWHESGQIRWERLTHPSVPAAMNRALVCATGRLVLFLDDDIIPAAGFIEAHVAAHGSGDPWAIVGQIIQPWQQPSEIPAPPVSDPLRADFDFPFHSTRSAELQNVMAGHLSVVRDRAITVGGFDENFRGSAFRFETEFARRVRRAGGRIRFEPTASIRHLRVSSGGTRIHGNHLASASPNHGVGDYYFALLHGWQWDVARYVSRRMVREVCTKFHLKHPWYIPVKLLGELRALIWAWQLRLRGPSLIERGKS
ncbi:MAG: glycosyltransferase family 2 protein [Planctomycetes bacterium]|nr:glycosyltransferase family 2 protein [Planctomycetota bacterium]